MIEKWKSRLLANHAVAGVELSLLPDNKISIQLVVLSVKKEIISVDLKQAEIPSVENLKEWLKAEVPVTLTINGKGILHKKVAASRDNDPLLVQSVLPNVKAEDFYLQKQPANEGGTFVSIIRKSLLDSIVQDFQKNGFFVVDVCLGAFCLPAIKPFLNLPSSHDFEISVDGHFLQYKNGLIDSYHSADKTGKKNISVGMETLLENFMLSFAAAYELLFQHPVSRELNFPALKNLKEEWEQKKIFKLAGWGALIFFLSVLLINFMVFSSLNSTYQEMSNEIANNKDQTERLEKLKQSIKEKEKFLSETGWLKPSQTTYYSDKVALTIPETILLTDLNIYPVEKNSKPEEKRILFNPRLITISGICNRSVDLNEWLKKVKKLSWITNVVVQQYSQNSEDEKGSFTVEITIQ